MNPTTWNFIPRVDFFLSGTFMTPLKKEGHIAMYILVGMTVSLTLRNERFVPEPSNLVGR